MEIIKVLKWAAGVWMSGDYQGINVGCRCVDASRVSRQLMWAAGCVDEWRVSG